MKTGWALAAGAFWAISASGVEEAELPMVPVEAAIIGGYVNGTPGFLTAPDGTKLYYHVNKRSPETGAIVLLQGRSENAAKYAELIYDLNQKGYSVFTYDHRGQGLSGGRSPDNPEAAYVKEYDSYVGDLRLFLEQVVRPAEHRNLHLLAHSMGAVIGALYLERYPATFQSAALVSPAFGLNTGYGDFVVKQLTCPWFGSGSGFARGKGPYEPGLRFTDSGNHSTTSQVRFEFFRAQQGSDPKATTGGPSDNWVCQSVKAGAKAKSGAVALKLPIFVALASDDADARGEDAQEFCRVARQCEAKVFPGKHELLQEKDGTRTPLLARILALFAASSPADAPDPAARTFELAPSTSPAR